MLRITDNRTVTMPVGAPLPTFAYAASGSFPKAPDRYVRQEKPISQETAPQWRGLALLGAATVALGGCQGAGEFAAASLAAAAVVPSLVAGAHILSAKMGPSATVGWLAAMAIPILGPLAWFALGAHPHTPTHEDPAVRFWHDRYLYRRSDHVKPDEIPEGVPDYFLPHLNLVRKLTREPLVSGNLIQPLVNGEQAYPEMITAIESEPPGGFVYIGKYIFENDEIGLQFAEALSRAQARGVEVRVIVDRVGQFVNPPKDGKIEVLGWLKNFFRPTGLQRLQKMGLAAKPFSPAMGFRNGIPLNVIYHKKFMVTSRTAFLGGINIGGTYLAANERNPNRHHDLHFLIDGPLAARIEAVHREDWKFITGTAASEVSERPHAGTSFARVIRSAPDDNYQNFRKTVMGAMLRAQKKVRLMTAYFTPDPEMLSAIELAAKSGVEVEIYLSFDNFVPPADWAARAWFKDLIKAGAKIYYQPPPFNHAKLLVVDDFYTLFGSANVDGRSQTFHWEVATEVYDPVFAKTMAAYVDAIKDKSMLVTSEFIDSWPWHERLRNGFFQIFGPLF